MDVLGRIKSRKFSISKTGNKSHLNKVLFLLVLSLNGNRYYMHMVVFFSVL